MKGTVSPSHGSKPIRISNGLLSVKIFALQKQKNALPSIIYRFMPFLTPFLTFLEPWHGMAVTPPPSGASFTNQVPRPSGDSLANHVPPPSGASFANQVLTWNQNKNKTFFDLLIHYIECRRIRFDKKRTFSCLAAFSSPAACSSFSCVRPGCCEEQGPASQAPP